MVAVMLELDDEASRILAACRGTEAAATKTSAIKWSAGVNLQAPNERDVVVLAN